MSHTFFVYRDRQNGKLLGYDEDAGGVGVFRPGLDGNYYSHIFFVSADGPTSPKDYLKTLEQIHSVIDEFYFVWEELDIVEFTIE